LRGGPDLGGREPLEADRVPDAVWASSVVWVHRHDFGGHPLIIADLGLDFVANPELENHNLSPPYSRWVLLFCDKVLPRDTFRINTLLGREPHELLLFGLRGRQLQDFVLDAVLARANDL